MRIRCSKGLRISGFHGHFFIRSTDLLALPQVRSQLWLFQHKLLAIDLRQCFL